MSTVINYYCVNVFMKRFAYLDSLSNIFIYDLIFNFSSFEYLIIIYQCILVMIIYKLLGEFLFE